MSKPKIHCCPGTLTPGYGAYSRTAQIRVFYGRKVSPLLPYTSAECGGRERQLVEENQKNLSLAGVQEKLSLVLDKNVLRLSREGERGTYILKPIPGAGKNREEMPANEHLSMQLARQVFGIETAENALVFFRDGTPAYICRRFDVREDILKTSGRVEKRAQLDFAALAGLRPQTHGAHYKYTGNYLQLFQLMQKYVPAYATEAPKLFRLLVFNYLIANGDAHYKNFSLLETPMGDYRLSPAYDLLNSRIHVSDSDFALAEGLLPPAISEGKIYHQFCRLAQRAGIGEKTYTGILEKMMGQTEQVKQLLMGSYLRDSSKRHYLQLYQRRLKQLQKI